jgi:hypothetical protein
MKTGKIRDTEYAGTCVSKMAKCRFRLTTSECATFTARPEHQHLSVGLLGLGTKTRAMLTNFRHDTWLMHLGRPDGCWVLMERRTWRVSDMEKKASCMRINSLSASSQIESSLMFFVFLPSKSGDRSSARVGAFAQRVARTIV